MYIGGFMIPIIDALLPLVSKVLDFIPDPQKKAEAQLKLTQELNSNSQAILNALAEVDKAQIAVNQEESKSSSLFVSGWRPWLGWVCGASFTWQYVIQPIATFVLTASGHPVILPTLDFSAMTPVMMGMLGLAGMRTWEKTQEVQNKH
jgi:hypothetical protein